jgi:hypothetical protein
MIPISDVIAMQAAAAATGNGTPAIVADRALLAAQVSGTFSATITWEGTADGSNWIGLQARSMAGGDLALTATAAGVYLIPCAGLQQVRARISAYTSGSVTVNARATTAPWSDMTPQSSAYPGTRVHLYSGGSQVTINAVDADSIASQYAYNARDFPMLFNGTHWDRERANTPAILLASAARTATTQSSDQTNYNGRGLILIANVTAATDTPEVTLSLQIKDSISNAYFTVWTGAAPITGTGTSAYLFVPGGAAGSFTEAVNLRLSRTWRLVATHADTDSITYSVSACVLT